MTSFTFLLGGLVHHKAGLRGAVGDMSTVTACAGRSRSIARLPFGEEAMPVITRTIFALTSDLGNRDLFFRHKLLADDILVTLQAAIVVDRNGQRRGLLRRAAVPHERVARAHQLR